MSKTVLITGASRGIGKAIAKKFANEGYNIVLCYNKSEKEAKLLASELSKNVSVLLKQVDVSKKEDIDSLYIDAMKNFGRIDVVVNNAGESRYNLLIDESYESISKLIQTNLTSIIYSCKKAAEIMMKTGGKIVNLSSMYAKDGASFETVYSATKSALVGFTEGLSRELGSAGIIVNNVAPGCIDTDMTKEFLKNKKNVDEFFANAAVKRAGKPDEVAELVYFLSSEKNTYITGQTIYIDGGI